MKSVSMLCILAVLALAECGCSAVRALVPGGVTAADAEWTGVTTGPAVSIAASLDGRAAALVKLAEALGQAGAIDLGVLLPLSATGESYPRWVICQGDLAKTCAAIPINTQVHFAGQATGPFWRPSRLKAEGK